MVVDEFLVRANLVRAKCMDRGSYDVTHYTRFEYKGLI